MTHSLSTLEASLDTLVPPTARRMRAQRFIALSPHCLPAASLIGHDGNGTDDGDAWEALRAYAKGDYADARDCAAYHPSIWLRADADGFRDGYRLVLE